MNPHCECTEIGFCKRHKIEKDAKQFYSCQGSCGTRDCGLRLWNAWENGLLGATAPEEPKILAANQWVCDETPKFMQKVVRAKPRDGLGDKVSNALSKLGITEERVTKWLGRPCGCGKRRKMLNQLGEWAEGVIRGELSARDLDVLIEEKK